MRAIRGSRCSAATWSELTEGDGRVYLEWDSAIVADAKAKDVALDPNGYLAQASLLNG
ncbi:MAG: hypothetical protein ABI301_02845 [Jatrophihabitantaceae bacterium]